MMTYHFRIRVVMIFEKRLRHQYEWTAGKERSFLNKPTRDFKKDLKKMPLLAPVLEISKNVLSLDDEKKRRILAHIEYDQKLRDRHAKRWRAARRIYFSLSEDLKQEIMKKWNAKIYPLTSVNFAHLVDVVSGNQAKRLAEISAKEQQEKLLKQSQIELFA